MDGDIVDQVRTWDSRSFSGGSTTLQELAANEFSGAVEAASTWVFFLNGNVIGVFDGSIEEIKDVEGTTYDAPGMALPLLFTMQQQGGEPKAQYYTEDTPLADVDETLADANFTGYVELSENVLSGDYYITYHGGRSLAAAFVGNQREVITGEEAFERAADEVGIYEVITVPIEVVDIPEPSEAPSAAGGVIDEAESPAQDTDADPQTDQSPNDSDDDQANTDTQASNTTPSTTTTPEPTEETIEPSSRPSSGSDEEPSTQEPPDTGANTTPDPATQNPGETTADREERFDEEAEWRETRTIPSLSPSDDDEADEPPRATASPAESSAQSTSANPESGVEKLEAALDEREQQLAELESELETIAAQREEAESARDSLEAELQSVRDERDRLAERVDALEEEVAEARTAEATSTASRGDRELTRAHALEETNLFIRYGSKGNATLEKVAEGASKETVNQNLQLDHHTQFDASNVTVKGEPFEAFLRSSPEFAFVEWVVRELPFEIRETGHDSDLAALYAAIPKIDRAQLRGSVSVETDEQSINAEFDVVLRGRKGDPLIVASINDSRDPVTGGMMEDLVDRTSTVAGEATEIAAAMSVTSSFFKPEALNVSEEVTGGGLLSGGSKASFVYTSRKQGYHLCLVESRNGSFHVTVPEL